MALANSAELVRFVLETAARVPDEPRASFRLALARWLLRADWHPAPAEVRPELADDWSFCSRLPPDDASIAEMLRESLSSLSSAATAENTLLFAMDAQRLAGIEAVVQWLREDEMARWRGCNFEALQVCAAGWTFGDGMCRRSTPVIEGPGWKWRKRHGKYYDLYVGTDIVLVALHSDSMHFYKPDDTEGVPAVYQDQAITLVDYLGGVRSIANLETIEGLVFANGRLCCPADLPTTIEGDIEADNIDGLVFPDGLKCRKLIIRGCTFAKLPIRMDVDSLVIRNVKDGFTIPVDARIGKLEVINSGLTALPEGFSVLDAVKVYDCPRFSALPKGLSTKSLEMGGVPISFIPSIGCCTQLVLRDLNITDWESRDLTGTVSLRDCTTAFPSGMRVLSAPNADPMSAVLKLERSLIGESARLSVDGCIKIDEFSEVPVGSFCDSLDMSLANATALPVGVTARRVCPSIHHGWLSMSQARVALALEAALGRRPVDLVHVPIVVTAKAKAGFFGCISRLVGVS